MELHIKFQFRATEHFCTAIINSSAYPCYIFATLHGPGMIREFGTDITIATDGKTRLPRKDDYTALVELRDAIFDVIKNVPEFRHIRIKMKIFTQQTYQI